MAERRGVAGRIGIGALGKGRREMGPTRPAKVESPGVVHGDMLIRLTERRSRGVVAFEDVDGFLLRVRRGGGFG